MKKLIAIVALSALCSLSATSWAAPNFEPGEVAEFEKFPTQFTNQTKCMQAVHYMRSAYSAVDFLAPEGLMQIAMFGYDVKHIKEQLLNQMPDIYARHGVKLRSFGLNLIDYSLYMNTMNKLNESMAALDFMKSLSDPNFKSEGYMGIFNTQMETCYTHFHEFEEDPDMEFEIFDSMPLPQDIGWDAFDLSMFTDYQGNPIKLDFNGKRI